MARGQRPSLVERGVLGKTESPSQERRVFLRANLRVPCAMLDNADECRVLGGALSSAECEDLTERLAKHEWKSKVVGTFFVSRSPPPNSALITVSSTEDGLLVQLRGSARAEDLPQAAFRMVYRFLRSTR